MASFVFGLTGMAIRSIRGHGRSRQDEDAQYYGQQAAQPAAYGYVPASANASYASGNANLAPPNAAYNPNYDSNYYPRKQRSGCQRKAERRYMRQMRREDRMARRAERWAPAPVAERHPAGPVAERHPARPVAEREVYEYTPETASVRDEPPPYEELEKESKTQR